MPEPTSVQYALPRHPAAASAARRALRGFVPGELTTRESLENAELVVTELVSNAVRHGSGQIELRLRREPDSLVVEVIDEGGAPPQAVRPVANPGCDRPGGWGLHIVERFAERWGVHDGTTHVWARLPLSSAGADAA